LLLLFFFFIFINKRLKMSRKKIPEHAKKIKISISISQELNSELEIITYNKSRYIEELLEKSIKKEKDGK
jgi:hypothetical protein